MSTKLKNEAASSPNRRARTCFHPTHSAPLQAMEIYVLSDAWIPPHVHENNRHEFYYLIKGKAALVWFDQNNPVISDSILLSSDSDTRAFYNDKAEQPHTFVILSEFLSFIECSNGPFIQSPSAVRWYTSFTDSERLDFWAFVRSYARDNYDVTE